MVLQSTKQDEARLESVVAQGERDYRRIVLDEGSEYDEFCSWQEDENL